MTAADINRRRLIIGGAMIAVGGTAYAAKPRRSENRLATQKLDDFIPKAIGPWSYASADGIVVARSEEPVESYDQVLTRVYSAAEQPDVMLLLAYGSTQGGSLQLHRPDTCYPGQGFRMSDFAEGSLDQGRYRAIETHRFTATRDERVERVFYWARIGDSFFGTTVGEYRAILSSVMDGVVPDGMLVRLSTIGVPNAAADRALARFAEDLVAATPARGRDLLVGPALARST